MQGSMPCLPQSTSKTQNLGLVSWSVSRMPLTSVCTLSLQELHRMLRSEEMQSVSCELMRKGMQAEDYLGQVKNMKDRERALLVFYR